MPSPEQLAALDALYAELPSIPCQGKCATACGPIEMSVAERERIIDLGVTIPRFTQAAAERWAENMKADVCRALIPNPFKPYGEEGRCGVYEARPMICRLWGLTESMPCPWGCQPTRVLTDGEGYDLLARSLTIGGWDDGQPPPEVHENMKRALEHPVVGPLMRRFIRDDASPEVRLKLESAMHEYGFVMGTPVDS